MGIDKFDTTIVAPATATGGAIAVIRLSGADSRAIVEAIFSKSLVHRTAVFGTIARGDEVVDEVLCTYFAAPHSYTGEDCVEISCHGSAWIVGEIVRLAVDGGAVAAGAGDFSRRAFLNGKMDLSQAEAVADLIMSESRASAKVALQQMRGGYKVELQLLRDKLLNITALLTLELDFSEEDVQFADRAELRALLGEVIGRCGSLCDSFKVGNAIKRGVSVAIVGAPNVGKSTLLNILVGEERSIVSNIAGTTRDYVEQHFTIDGVLFRFIDTAGIRALGDTADIVENEGIRRSVEQAQNADIVLHLTHPEDVASVISSDALTVYSKCDTYAGRGDGLSGLDSELYISARSGEGLDALRRKLVELSGVQGVDDGALMVTNARHFGALQSACILFKEALAELSASALPTGAIDSSSAKLSASSLSASALDSSLAELSTSGNPTNTPAALGSSSAKLSTSGDPANAAIDSSFAELSTSGDPTNTPAVLVATGFEYGGEPDKVCALLRSGLDCLAEITGEITTDELLSTIFSRFCIGK